MAEAANEIQVLKKELQQSKKKEKKLEEKVEELSDFIENASLPLHWVDGEGKIIWANHAELEALGYSKKEYIGRPITDFHADKDVIDDILKRLTNNETLHNYPARLKCKDGTIKHVLINSNVLWKDGKFVHTRCFTRDISSLKKEEERKNRLLMDLAQFAYVTSHDLRSPLRAISTLADFLHMDYYKKLDKKGREYLTLIKNRITQMSELLEGILNYSKINLSQPAEEKLEKVDTGDILNAVIEHQKENSDKEVLFTIEGKLPEVTANKNHIRLIFENLINNAIFFNDKPDVKITIGYKEKKDEWEFYIKDNGPGIEPQYREKIFKMFQTLRKKQEHNRAGIGLALVKKIVENYQGKIRMESEAGKGTTFYFTFPKNLEEKFT